MAVVGQTLNDPSRTRQMSVAPEEFLNGFRETSYRMLFPQSLLDGAGEIKALSTFTSLRDDMFDSLPLFLPNFRLLNIVRNGLEVVASRLKHAHISKAGDFRTHCIAWAHSIDIIRWFGQHAELKDRLFLVRHELLLQEDSCQEVFGRVQKRFGLERSDACEKFVRENFVSRNTVEDAVSPQTKEGAESRSRAWKSWTEDQRSVFEEVCGPAMAELSYEIPW